MGKTYTSIKIAKQLNLLTHIVVPSIQLKEQWEVELSKHNFKAEVFVINSYIKTPMISEFLIIDEVHRVANDEAICFSQVIHSSTSNYFLALTATIKQETKDLFQSMGVNLIREIGFKEAIENEWVSAYVEYNYHLSLTDEEQLAYNAVNKKYESSFNYFLRNYENAMGCLDKDFREAYCNRWNRDPKITLLNSLSFSNSVRKRKEILYNAHNKLQAILDIIEDNPDDEVVIFSESTDFCDRLHEILPKSTIYHSKISKKKKDKNLSDFLEGKYKYLIGAKSVDQGFDKPSVSLGIIASGTSSTLQHRQRVYRVTRFVRGKQSKIYNLVIKGTQEEQWCKLRQKENKQKPIII